MQSSIIPTANDVVSATEKTTRRKEKVPGDLFVCTGPVEKVNKRAPLKRTGKNRGKRGLVLGSKWKEWDV